MFPQSIRQEVDIFSKNRHDDAPSELLFMQVFGNKGSINFLVLFGQKRIIYHERKLLTRKILRVEIIESLDKPNLLTERIACLTFTKMFTPQR